jgi:hypothetical protein
VAKKGSHNEFEVALQEARTKLKEGEDKVEERFKVIEEKGYPSLDRIRADSALARILMDADSAIKNLRIILVNQKKSKVIK